MDDGSGFGRDGRDPRAGMNSADLQGLAGMPGIPQGRGDSRDPRGPMGIGGRDGRDVRETIGRDAGRGADSGAGSEAGPKLEVIQYQGRARAAGPDGQFEPTTVTLDQTGVVLEVGTGRPIRAAYRDLTTVAIQQSTVLLVMGDGLDAMRWLLAQFGDKLGPIVRELRERRLKQRLSDGLVKVPDAPAELVEYDWQPTSDPIGPGPDGPAAPVAGVGQLVVCGWGFFVSPVDERTEWIHYRRAAIATVTQPAAGDVRIDGGPGTLTLRGLGSASERLHGTLEKLRDGAFADAAGFVEGFMPDAPFGVRQKASQYLVDGQPVRPRVFGDSGWPIVETAVLGEPTFADSYAALCATAGPAAPRWVAMSPVDPGGKDPKIWFLIAMPGNLIALELVTAGAHATYFYRVMPRAEYRGEAPEALGVSADQAVRDVSEALVDCRFLREPMALPADQLRLPQYLRYRLALAVLPTLAAARARFVARIVHRDAASWSAAVAGLVTWHSSAKDEGAEWPGRAAQEAQVAAAGGTDGDGGDDDGGSEALPADESTIPEESKPTGPSGTAG